MFYDNYVMLCNKAGKSPSAVAVELGHHRSDVTRWSKGSAPRRATLLKMASYFGVAVDDLLKGEETKKAPTVSGERPEVLGDDRASFAARTTVMVELFEQLSVEDQNDVLFRLLEKARGLPGPDEHR